MNVEIIKHSEWAETKFTLHLISQILGKIKLETAPQEPQWTHVTLDLTVDGFTTGLLFADMHAFQIDVDVRASRLLVNVDGASEAIELKTSKSIKDYYHELFGALRSRGVNITIHPKAQEMAYQGNLNEDTAPLTFHQADALKGLRLLQFALQEELKFIAPMRCRKMKPALFWGTFDVSMLVLPGIFEPFPHDKLIEKAAFDEHMIEYGFWMGDDQVDVPTFFVLPYPFQFKELPASSLRPAEAYYDKTKSEYFLDLESVISSPSPSQALQAFFRSTFGILSEELGWESYKDYFVPLDMPKQQGKDD